MKSRYQNIECWWFFPHPWPLADPNSFFLYMKYQRSQCLCQMARADKKWSKGSSITAGFCPTVSTRVEKTDLIDKVSTFHNIWFAGALLDCMCSFEYSFKTHEIVEDCADRPFLAFLRHIVWFGIPDKGPIPESRVWSILSIKQGKNGVSILAELYFCIHLPILLHIFKDFDPMMVVTVRNYYLQSSLRI